MEEMNEKALLQINLSNQINLVILQEVVKFFVGVSNPVSAELTNCSDLS